MASEWTISTDESGGEHAPDEFSHERYVRSIQRLVSDSSRGMTLGLFGRYGTGKTWVVKTLRSNLELTRSDVQLVEYDAWRYADDEIRRDLLVHLRAELLKRKLLKPSAPKIEVDSFKLEIKEAREGPDGFSIAAFGKALKTSIPLGLILLALGGLAGAAVGLTIDGWNGFLGFVIAGLSFGGAWALAEVRSLLSVSRLTVKTVTESKRARTEFPEEFLALFKQLVDARTCPSLIIAVDNLDRCAPETAMRVLSTIKNFLEPEDSRIYFLIPCDREALERHLAALFESRGLHQDIAAADAREYLDKFFAASISMTPFDSSDLSAMTNAILRRARATSHLGDEDRDAISAISVSANRRSPREVRAFLNKVFAASIVLDESGIHTTDSPSIVDIAKLVAIQEKCPALWRTIQEDPVALQTAEHQLTSVGPDGVESSLLDDPETKRLVRALQWHSIPSAKIAFFVGLKMPREAADVARYYEYSTALEDADIDTADSVARATPEEHRPRLISIATARFLSLADRAPQRAQNPAIVGLHLLAQYEMPPLQQRQFLAALHGPTATAAVRRIGPTEAAAVLHNARTLPEGKWVADELVTWLGSGEDTEQTAVAEALDSIQASLTAGQIVALRTRIDTALVAGIGFERHLRAMSSNLKAQVVSDASVKRLLQLFELPADDTAPNTADAFDTLRAHASLLTPDHTDELARSGGAFLERRAAGSAPLTQEDLDVADQLVRIGESSGAPPTEAFGPAISLMVARPDAADQRRLIVWTGRVEPRLGPSSRTVVQQFASRLLSNPEGLGPSEGTSLVRQAALMYSNESKLEVLTTACTIFGSSLAADVGQLVLELSRSAKSWIDLRSIVQKSLAASESFGPLHEWIETVLEPAEFTAVYRGLESALSTLLAQPASARAAATSLLHVVTDMDEAARREVVDRACRLLNKQSELVVSPNAELLAALLPTVPADDAEPIVDAAIASLDGPSAFAAPEQLLRLQLAVVPMAKVGPRAKLREAIRKYLVGLDADPTQCFAITGALMQKASVQKETAVYLFQPVFDYAAQVANGAWRDAGISVMESMLAFVPDETKEAVVEGLTELSAISDLPPGLAGLVSK